MILKTKAENYDVLHSIVKENHHLTIVDEDFEDDGEVYVIAVEELEKDNLKVKIRECAIEWMTQYFEAIPIKLFFKAYVESETEEVKILTSDLEGEGYEYLTYSNFPNTIHSFFLVREHIDIDWILNNLDVVSQCGFDVYESNDYLFLGINGIGYDLIERHWIPLYLQRGIRWHEL